MYQSQFWFYLQFISIFGEIGILLKEMTSVQSHFYFRQSVDPLLNLKAERRGSELRDFYSATGTEEHW
jgi:hypothetical protein